VFTFKALQGETGRGLQRKPNVKQGLGTQLLVSSSGTDSRLGSRLPH